MIISANLKVKAEIICIMPQPRRHSRGGVLLSGLFLSER